MSVTHNTPQYPNYFVKYVFDPYTGAKAICADKCVIAERQLMTNEARLLPRINYRSTQVL